MQTIRETDFKKGATVSRKMCSAITFAFHLVSCIRTKSTFRYPILIHNSCFSFISYLDVTYLVLCASSYPTVLAFSFLNELMKEFISLYNKTEIHNVVRPYCFLNFGKYHLYFYRQNNSIPNSVYPPISDNFIHKTCQRYNKPQSLTTRINLSELSLEIKLRPPYVISLSELEPAKNVHCDIKLPYTGTIFIFEFRSYHLEINLHFFKRRMMLFFLAYKITFCSFSLHCWSF